MIAISMAAGALAGGISLAHLAWQTRRLIRSRGLVRFLLGAAGRILGIAVLAVLALRSAPEAGLAFLAGFAAVRLAAVRLMRPHEEV